MLKIYNYYDKIQNEHKHIITFGKQNKNENKIIKYSQKTRE